MTQRLRDIVDRLYKPSADGIRQAFALSRGEAEKLPRLPSIAVISITAPERPPARLDGFEHLLRLSFADVDCLNPYLSKRARASLVHAFTADQARAIRSFVEAFPSEIASIVAHCEGGYSRSCAIVVALHHLYQYRVDFQHLSQANHRGIRLMLSK